MAFFDHRLSDRIERGAVFGPMWSTTLPQARGGAEYPNRNWTYPLHGGDIAMALRTNADFEAVRAMFYNVYGMTDCFRFRDWSDYQLTQTNSSLVFITGSTWQINRVYSIGSCSFVRPILKIADSPAAVIYRNRASVISVATSSVATSTGIATISGHVGGDTYTCVGQFDVPVRFGVDIMRAENVQSGAADFLMRWSAVPIIERRNPD
jgi:uncharacterized protein (TIGR02217 family)